MHGTARTREQIEAAAAREGLSTWDEGFRAALEGELADVIACAALLRYEQCRGNLKAAAESLGISRGRMHAVMRASGRDPRREAQE